MVEILSVLLLLIFASLGGIHFYWVLGGKWGLEQALPTKEAGEKALQPGKLVTIVVGLGLTFFGIFYLMQSGLVDMHLPDWVNELGAWFIPGIFTIRAIGDFNYVGFFKKIKNTTFAKADSTFFSPLCMIIGVMGFIIQLNH